MRFFCHTGEASTLAVRYAALHEKHIADTVKLQALSERYAALVAENSALITAHTALQVERRCVAEAKLLLESRVATLESQHKDVSLAHKTLEADHHRSIAACATCEMSLAALQAEHGASLAESRRLSDVQDAQEYTQGQLQDEHARLDQVCIQVLTAWFASSSVIVYFEICQSFNARRPGGPDMYRYVTLDLGSCVPEQKAVTP